MGYLLAISFVLCGFSLATPAQAQTSNAKKKVVRAAPRNQWHMRVGANMWQESLKVSNDVATGHMDTQSQGMYGSLGYLITSRTPWSQWYGFDVGLGSIKGKGDSATIPDELKGQPWVMATFTPGVIYRGTPVSSVGLMLPLSYRLIEWKFKEGSTFRADAGSPFGVGISGVYMNYFTKVSGLMLSVTHQPHWNATIWSIAWQYRLR